MENKPGLLELTENELRDCNGGFILGPLTIFIPSIKKIRDFLDGLKEGYDRATQY